MTTSCTKCSDDLNLEDAVICHGTCKGVLHYGCAGVREVKYRNKSQQEKDSWCCAGCVKSIQVKTGTPKQTTVAVQDDLTAILKAIQVDIKDIKEDQKTFEKSLNFMSTQFDSFKKELANIKKLTTAVDQVQQDVKKQDEVINGLADRTAQLEQYTRRHHLEFSNITETKDENLKELIVDIADLHKVKMVEANIEVIHRLPIRKGQKVGNVIAEFGSRNLRDTLLKAKKGIDVTNKNLFEDGNDLKIYINESLSPYFRKLLWEAKVLKKAKNYAHCWFRGSRVYVRKTDADEAIPILNEKDLAKII